MTNMINLNDIVPGLDGTTFQYGDKEYKLRGDLPSEQVFEFLKLYDDLLKFQASALEAGQSGDEKQIEETMVGLRTITEKIREKLLAVFRLEHPDLEELPFGAQSTIIVLGEVLKAVGLIQPPAEDDAGDFPLRPRPARKTRTTTTTRSSKATSQRRRTKKQ